MTSGRFTPAAMTFTRISPLPGEGTGALVATRTSGPPGSRNGYARHRFRQMVFRHEYPLFQIPLEVWAGRITPPAAGVTTGKGAAKNPLCRSSPHARRGRRRSAKKEDISRDWPGSHADFGC